jgi:hypothetical protein
MGGEGVIFLVMVKVEIVGFRDRVEMRAAARL